MYISRSSNSLPLGPAQLLHLSRQRPSAGIDPTIYCHCIDQRQRVDYFHCTATSPSDFLCRQHHPSHWQTHLQTKYMKLTHSCILQCNQTSSPRFHNFSGPSRYLSNTVFVTRQHIIYTATAAVNNRALSKHSNSGA